MQIGGVGGGHNHSMHQVTGCMHEHEVPKKGNVAAAPSRTDRTEQRTVEKDAQTNSFSLGGWWRETLADARKLLGKLWGAKAEGTGTADNSATNVAGEAVAASASLRQPSQENNPYFTAIEDTGRAKQTIWEKVKVRFRGIAGQLTGRFAGKNSFQTKQEKPKEDLRKHSTYRRDDVELECVLTDDSYLLDSYDRKGEYSKLSTKK